MSARCRLHAAPGDLIWGGTDGGGGAARAQVIEDVSLQAEGADDYERKLTQLRREEELIHEEAREAAAVLRADMPTLRAGEARCPTMPWVGRAPCSEPACCAQR